MIDDASGGRHNHMWTVSELKGLRHHVHAAYDNGGPDIERRAQHRKLFRYLESQLAAQTESTDEVADSRATYRVGVNTSAKIPYGSTDSFCNIGSAKAMVLPDPVFAFPIQSLPWMETASVRCITHHDCRPNVNSPASRGGTQAV